MKQLLRSSMSIVGDSFSEPMTSILATLPLRIMSAATPTAYPKPAHPAEISNAGTPVAPNPEATAGALAGVCKNCVLVATITPSMSVAVTAEFELQYRG